ncbi:DNA cytosine methyltransferase [Paenochrobactrum pullorum]|uniref:DNA cytosine methyltransferase n=1 Tax=Paenochrobactrum pullorum TaxID=1324351 RepID=UPI0035BC3186
MKNQIVTAANYNFTTKWAYYNEFDPYAAQWLRNLIAAGHIAPGEVDERSIADVHADDLKGFKQCHFFAGIGGWSLAARFAGWPDERSLWTGSAPCQPFSVAGKQEAQNDERHLWPKFFELIRDCKPTTIMGEQVSAAIRFGWLDGVSADLESEGYTTGAVIIPACAVNAPHRRDRLWFVADAHDERGDGQLTCKKQAGRNVIAFNSGVALAYTDRNGCQAGSAATTATRYRNTADTASGPVRSYVANTDNPRSQGHGRPIDEHDTQGRQEPDGHSASHSFWHGAEYITGPDGKARRIEPRIRLLAHGVPARVGKVRAYGNAIVPQVAAEIIKSYMECRP